MTDWRLTALHLRTARLSLSTIQSALVDLESALSHLELLANTGEYLQCTPQEPCSRTTQEAGHTQTGAFKLESAASPEIAARASSQTESSSQSIGDITQGNRREGVVLCRSCDTQVDQRRFKLVTLNYAGQSLPCPLCRECLHRLADPFR